MPTRRGRPLFRAALLATLAPGCFWAQKRPPAPVRHPTEAESGVTVLRTALADRPAGDAYLADGIWAYATRPLPHELAALLARNGLRAGLVTGVPSAEFLALMSNPAGLVDPADRTFTPGRTNVVPVAGPIAHAEFALTSTVAADPVPGAFDAAECGLAVTATPLSEGRVTLECEPRFQYGEPRSFILPAADATFTRRERKSREQLGFLAFKVTLGPGEALVVGPTNDPAGTLGGAFFVDADPARVRQRLLVIQVKP